MAATGYKYPWDIWFNGKAHTLVQGKDFDISPEDMRRRIYSRGQTNEVSVRTMILDARTLVVKAVS